jgi:hypothetical protein
MALPAQKKSIPPLQDTARPLAKAFAPGAEPLAEAAVRALNFRLPREERGGHVEAASKSNDSNLVFRALMRETDPEFQQKLAHAFVRAVAEKLAAYTLKEVQARGPEEINIWTEKNRYKGQVGRQISMVVVGGRISPDAEKILDRLKPLLVTDTKYSA